MRSSLLHPTELVEVFRRVSPPDPARVAWLGEWHYAHRGLHGNGRVENSASAFAAALDAGMGIECDIQRSADYVPMVFHDWDFARLIGRPERTEALTEAEWKTLSYLEHEEAPVALADLLAAVGGRVPVLIEVKSKRGYDVVRSCEAVAGCLAVYEGPHAVMSFDPRVARWFRKHSPGTVAGLVIREDEVGYTQAAWQRRLAFRIARPDFVAYHINALPSPWIASLRKRGFPILTWTVDSAAKRELAARVADAPIAEGAGVA